MGDDEASRTLPRVSAEVRDDGTGAISVDGVIERIQMATLQEAGAAITARVAALAGEVGHPVPVTVRDPDGMWDLLIHADGLVDEAPGDLADDHAAPQSPALGAPVAADARTATPGPTSEPAPVPATSTSNGAPTSMPAAPTAAPTSGQADPSPAPTTGPTTGLTTEPTTEPTTGPTAGPTSASGAERPAAGAGAAVAGHTGALPTLDDLLAARHPASTGPAEEGWRVGVRRVTFGAIHPGPGRAERRRRVQVASVRRTLDGPRTVVVINPKGGAHKTTATMLLAATFGLQRGGYTLAWDNNETRGTLGWRSVHTDHTRTAVDLLHALPSLGGDATVRLGDLDGFVRTQADEQFDVLASDEDASSATLMDAAAFESLHQVLSRFYRVLVVDTGNNMRASNWQAAVAAADQIVVVSTIREDTAQSAAWALDALRATGHEDAVRSAVTILSAPDARVDKDLRKRLRTHFGALTRAVVEVPHDPALVAGGPITYEALHPTTRDAWLRAAAVVADGL
ncbi:chromosome partitioning protein [Cellulomonas composti]|uniref:Chromosome partitioning protein n=1 Tax=Cellulomonas composti TaxID=266130 RepID=A0A511JBC5_9CELL|nr:chromosome partitioning protein [Cellulomonas composti]GEL95285.1 hypothetical protein CCO02nite_19430 [Cellulomonas composti]